MEDEFVNEMNLLLAGPARKLGYDEGYVIDEGADGFQCKDCSGGIGFTNMMI
jgi:hypothetical protein